MILYRLYFPCITVTLMMGYTLGELIKVGGVVCVYIKFKQSNNWF